MTRYRPKLKCNPPIGQLPVLQYVQPEQLTVDETYQRSLLTDTGQTLVRKIAQFWNWDLCQPLVVSRRDGDARLYVIDGQHRLAAARLRGDIHQLPCVVVSYPDAAAEAASFVQLNQQRRPLNQLEIFRAAVAGGDPEAQDISAAMTHAGLVLAPHSNYTAWTPAMVSNIGGIQRAWRNAGPEVTEVALVLLGKAFDGQVKRYAGTIFPGIVLVCRTLAREERQLFCDCLAATEQADWRAEIVAFHGSNPDEKYQACSEAVIASSWADYRNAFLGEDEE